MSEELNKQKALRLDEMDAHEATRKQFHDANHLNGEIAQELGLLIPTDGGFRFERSELVDCIKIMKREIDDVVGDETFKSIIREIVAARNI